MLSQQKITIPARKNAPEATLHVETITDETNLLDSRKVILLVPGGPGGNHSVYNSVRDELHKFGNLVLFDPRGCGYSDQADPQHCTIHHFIDDIEALRQQLKMDKIILLGGSYGAMASIGYAIKYQSHIEQLILLGGSPNNQFITLAKKNILAKGTTLQIQAAENLWNGTFKNAEHFAEYYKTMAPLYLFKGKKQQTPTTKENIPYNISITNFGFSGFLRTFDFSDDLHKITCPTLILAGKHDWINDPSIAQAMAKRIPYCRLIVLEECGHFIWEDQREKFFEAIANFLVSEKLRYTQTEPRMTFQVKD